MARPVTPPPDGVSGSAPMSRGRSNWWSLALLGAIVLGGLSGRLGGGPNDMLAAVGDSAELQLDIPGVVRNGEVLETRVKVLARRPIGQLVVGVEPRLWHQLTTNSTVPAASSESYRDGLLRFAYGALEPGHGFVMQISQQVNPSLLGTNRGRLVILDGERPLVQMALALTVLP